MALYSVLFQSGVSFSLCSVKTAPCPFSMPPLQSFCSWARSCPGPAELWPTFNPCSLITVPWRHFKYFVAPNAAKSECMCAHKEHTHTHLSGPTFQNATAHTHTLAHAATQTHCSSLLALQSHLIGAQFNSEWQGSLWPSHYNREPTPPLPTRSLPHHHSYLATKSQSSPITFLILFFLIFVCRRQKRQLGSRTILPLPSNS